MSSTSSLKGTLWVNMYSTFGQFDDLALCNWMSTIGLLYTVIVGFYSIFKPAPYGRYTSSVFGPTINAKLAWMLQECPAFLVPVLLMLTTSHPFLTHVPNLVGLSMFLLHYFQRSFVFPLALAESAKQVPVSVMLSAALFCSYNGFLQGHFLLNAYKVNHFYLAFLGVPLFLAGMFINIKSDRMLIELRKTATRTDDGRTEYKIPRGFLFEYISGANYFGEILEWWALALITRGYPQIVFAIFSNVFLGLRAYHHHQFYRKTFGQRYPPSRKAIIPFIL